MLYRYLLINLLFFISVLSNAQSMLAKLKFEKAEQAFAKSNCALTLQSLDEVEKLLGGTNAKTLYLRIKAEKCLIDKGGFDNTLLNNAQRHIKEYQALGDKSVNNSSKANEILQIEEALNKLLLPAVPTATVIDSQAELVKQQEAELKIKQQKADAFIDSVCKVWKWLPGSSKDELKLFNNKLFKFAAISTARWYSNKAGDSLFYKDELPGDGQVIVASGPKNTITAAVIRIDVVKESLAKEWLQKTKALIAQYFQATDVLIDNENEIGVKGYRLPITLKFSIRSKAHNLIGGASSEMIFKIN